MSLHFCFTVYYIVLSRPERLRDIALRFKLDPEEALDNVIYSRAYNSEHQMDLITLLAAKFSEEPGRYKLLIVDSIISMQSNISPVVLWCICTVLTMM